MIQEKDFLYRVPVKTAPITTPRGQIRNPEILVDLEGGEFMHGNILDANSTNKLINQSVKDAVDNKLIESGYVTKDLLEAETRARTKGDEALGAKIKAEQTRAEGKEKEILDKLAIVDGDSNTEGSFRKAIADVIAAAPEDLDTLKEIADKLAGNDDLYTALNQAITEKADAAALSNYVLTAALNQQVDTLNTAISAKQDAGSYIPYDATDTTIYKIDKPLKYKINNDKFGFFDNGKHFYIGRSDALFEIISNSFGLSTDGRESRFTVYNFSVTDNKSRETIFSIGQYGIKFKDRKNTEVPVADGSGFADLNDYAKKTELPTVPTKISQLTNDSNFIAANRISDAYIGLEKDLKIYSENIGRIMTISNSDIRLETDDRDFTINNNGFFISNDDDGEYICSFTPSGIRFAGKTTKHIPTANGTFVNSDDFASADDIYSVKVTLSGKQNKIEAHEVDITDIETADITKLRTIVTNLINALSASNLIIKTQT